MKRIVILLLVVCMMVGLSACGSNWHDDLQINIRDDHAVNLLDVSIKNQSEKEITDGMVEIEFEYKGSTWTVYHSFKDLSPSDSCSILIYASNNFDDYTIKKVTYEKQDPVTN
ncbi:MAG: hypothetical protein ACC608_05555 [Anaerofustis sp.]